MAAPDSVVIERPKNREHGDYATNVALQLAKPAGRPPREVAEVIAGRLRESAGHRRGRRRRPGLPQHPRSTPAPRASWPGRSSRAGADVRPQRRRSPASGSTSSSSRPTRPGRSTSAARAGPPSATRSRGCCSASRRATSTREYYFNDAGAQIDRFAASLLAAAHGRAGPRGRLRRRLHRRDRRQIVAAQRPGVARPARRRGAGGLPPRGHRADVRRDQAVAGTTSASTSTSGSPSSRCTTSGAVDARARAAARRRATSTRTTARSGCAPPTSATTRTGCCVKSDGEPAYFAGRLRLLPRQARARLRPLHLHARRRPPRLRRPAARRSRPASATTPTQTSRS